MPTGLHTQGHHVVDNAQLAVCKSMQGGCMNKGIAILTRAVYMPFAICVRPMQWLNDKRFRTYDPLRLASFQIIGS